MCRLSAQQRQEAEFITFDKAVTWRAPATGVCVCDFRVHTPAALSG